MPILTLRDEMRKTAAALSRTRVIIEFEEDITARWYATPMIYRPNRPAQVFGFCALYPDGTNVIVVNPGTPAGDLYKTFLHETAHAFIHGLGMALPDPEAAADEIASIWAVSVARRAPLDMREFIAWLEPLRNYHRTNRNDYQFSKGANAGRLLPMATDPRRLARRVI